MQATAKRGRPPRSIINSPYFNMTHETPKDPTEWDELPLLITPKLICKLMGVNEVSVGKWLKSGELKGVKRANKWYVTKEEFKRFLTPYGIPE